MCAIFLSMACHERIIVYPPPRTPAVSSPQAGDDTSADLSEVSLRSTSPPSDTTVSPIVLVEAEGYFGRGEYPQAIQAYEDYLAQYPQDESRDRALYNLGLSHALASGADRSLSEARISLSRLLEEFPVSRYRSGASLILDLIAQVEKLDRNVRQRNSEITRLEEELKRLKEIDLKRRPSRPE